MTYLIVMKQGCSSELYLTELYNVATKGENCSDTIWTSKERLTVMSCCSATDEEGNMVKLMGIDKARQPSC